MPPISAPIDCFEDGYFFLSNFYPCVVRMRSYNQAPVVSLPFPTVEHAFQATKSLDVSIQEQICYMPTPRKAKRAGGQNGIVSLRPDWEDIKIKVMCDLVRQKFSNTTHPCNIGLREQLLATGNRELVEGNWWGDTFWGVCNGFGRNELGRILMNIRAELCRRSRKQ